jgi:zinc transport system substrate-binding protein
MALAAAGCLLWAGCDRNPDDRTGAAVAVSNSYLASAVRELAGADLSLTSLAPPGTCPGHFDIRPSQVEQLRRCRVLLRFDFQASADARLLEATGNGLAIHAMQVPSALCEPSSYLAACRQAGEVLVQAELASAQDVQRNLTRVEQNLAGVSAELREQMAQARLEDRPVLSSRHQEGFCRWLGLRVVATFSGGDSASLGQLDSAIEAGRKASVRLVVGNQPEGRGAADLLAERLGANVVMFDNFPATPQDKGTYEAMVRENVNRLVQTGRP